MKLRVGFLVLALFGAALAVAWVGSSGAAREKGVSVSATGEPIDRDEFDRRKEVILALTYDMKPEDVDFLLQLVHAQMMERWQVPDYQEYLNSIGQGSQSPPDLRSILEKTMAQAMEQMPPEMRAQVEAGNQTIENRHVPVTGVEGLPR